MRLPELRREMIVTGLVLGGFAVPGGTAKAEPPNTSSDRWTGRWTLRLGGGAVGFACDEERPCNSAQSPGSAGATLAFGRQIVYLPPPEKEAPAWSLTPDLQYSIAPSSSATHLLIVGTGIGFEGGFAAFAVRGGLAIASIGAVLPSVGIEMGFFFGLMSMRGDVLLSSDRDIMVMSLGTDLLTLRSLF